jgi:uncharacterized protein
MADEIWTGTMLPSVCPETAPFWAACNNSQFLVQRCESCDKPQYHYRALCCHCWSDNVKDVPIEGTGKVWSFSVVEKNKTAAFASWGRYAVGVVEVPEGVKIVTRIDSDDLDALAIGTEVKLTFSVAGNGQKIPHFKVP